MVSGSTGSTAEAVSAGLSAVDDMSANGGCWGHSGGSSGTLRSMKQVDRQAHLDRLAAVREMVRELESAVDSGASEGEPDDADDQPGLE